MERWRDIRSEDARGFEAQDGANAFSAGEDGVTHGGVDGRRLGGGRRQQLFERGIDSEAVVFEKLGKFHRRKAAALFAWPLKNFTSRLPLQVRRVRRRVCRRLS